MDSFHLSALKVTLNHVGAPELLLQTEFVTPEFVEFCKDFDLNLIPLKLSFDTGFKGIRFFNSKDGVSNVLNISPSFAQVKDYTNFFKSDTSKHINKTLDVLGKAYHAKQETLSKDTTVKIEDHIQYTLNLDTKTRTISWEITHQSPEFTKFFKDLGDRGKFTSTCFPELRFRDDKLIRIYFKGTHTQNTAEYTYKSSESVSSYLKTYTEIKEAIEEGIKYFISNYKGIVCKLSKIGFINDAVGKVILDLESGMRFTVLENDYVVALYGTTKYVSGTVVKKNMLPRATWVILVQDMYTMSYSELIDKNIIPSASNLSKCKFI